MKAIFGTVAVIAVFVFLWWIFFYIGWDSNYSDGQRTGNVFKISHKGLIYKSWEGQMYLGALTSDGQNGLVPTEFDFSIPDNEAAQKQDLIARLQQCAETRNPHCTIVYKQWFKSPIYQDTSY